jgi:hypothetical protein
MRRHIWSGISAAVVLVATVGVAAQEPSPQNPPQPAPQPPATAPATAQPQSDAQRVTVAGCLQAAPEGPVGTSGSAAPTPAPSPAPEVAAKPEGGSRPAKLVLANAVPSPAEATANASNSAPRIYRLIANETALMPHVGKKVELSGTIENQTSPSPSASAESNDSSAANAPQLRVEAGKVVAETCTP